MGMERSVDGRAVVVLIGVLAGLLVMSAASAQDAAPKASATNGPENVYALTAADDLLRFDGDNPQAVDRDSITGLVGGESLVGIDFRPSSQTPGLQGELYGIGGRGGIYVINEENGTAERTGTLVATNGDRVALRGNNFGIDFNPTVDRLRIVSDADQNLRVNVDTGETTVDPDIRYGNRASDADTTGVAYTNSRPAAFGDSTRLFYAETMRDRLATTEDANSGVITSVGGFGVATRPMAGFDVVTRDSRNAAYGALRPEGSSGAVFYNIDRSSGQARRIGVIAAGQAMVEGIAIPIGQR